MKKIIALFMVFLPLFVIGILFATGLIIKDVTHVSVLAVEMIETSKSIQWKDDSTPIETPFADNVRVIPDNATDPTVFYTTDTKSNVLSVDYERGIATTKDFGKTTIYASSKENPTLKDKCDVEVWDDKIHRIDILNAKNLSFMNLNETAKIEAKPVPTGHGIDQTLTYKVKEGDENKIKVDEKTGLVSTSNQIGSATIIIESKKYNVKKELNIYIGATLDSISFDNSSSEIINDDTYDLFDHLVTFPIDKSKTKPTDFAYTSSDSSIARVDENGKVTFINKPNQQVTFTVALKDDLSLQTKKTLSSTKNNYIDISFDKYSVSVTKEEMLANKAADIHLNAYPKNVSNPSLIKVTSQNERIISYKNGEFVFGGDTGTTSITASITNGSITKNDTCYVTVSDKSLPFIKTEDVECQSAYFNLKSLLQENILPPNTNVTWSTSAPETDAYIDNDNGILHFKKSIDVQITASASGFKQQSVKITCKQIPIQFVPIDSSTSINVGKALAFGSEADPWTIKLTQEQEKLFDIVNDKYITKIGSLGKINITICHNDEEKTVPLIITEEANDIKTSSPNWPNYTTASKIVNVGKELTIAPSTATNQAGEPIKPNFKYNIITPEASQENDVIRFNQISTVGISTTIANRTLNFSVKSTFGDGGKFIIKSDDNILQSGSTIELNSNDLKVLSINATDVLVDGLDITQETVKQLFKVSTLNKSGDVCYISEPTYDSDKKTINFVLSSHDTLHHGSDVITIVSGQYSFYLNINVKPTIKSIDLVCNSKSLVKDDKGINTFYDKKALIYISINPINIPDISNSFEVKWNTIDITDKCKNFILNLRDIDDQYWKTSNELTISSKINNLAPQTYKINYSTDDPTNVSVIDAVDQNIYLDSNTINALFALQLGTDIDPGFASQEYFEQKLIGSKFDETDCKIFSNYLVAQLPEQKNEIFNGTLKVKFGLKDLSFNVSRDYVTKVTLPNHINDEYDLKGMQKVHVYGNQSFYNTIVDYYKLPINIYGFDGKLIEDKNIKENAFKDLKASINNEGSYEYVKGGEKEESCIHITFNKDNLYSLDEIINDEFVDGHKNTTFTVATHNAYFHHLTTRNTFAQYSFVPVEAINVFNQEGLKKGSDKPIAFQVNFGLENVEKDNVIFNDDTIFQFACIYGNGYGICFDARTNYCKSQKILSYLRARNIINAKIYGCYENTLANIDDKYLSLCILNGPQPFLGYWKYCIFSKFFQCATLCEKSETHINNCIFTDNMAVSCSISDAETKVYFEEVAFFHSSWIGINQHLGSEIYFKGNIESYNFRGEDMFKQFGDIGIIIWNTVAEPILRRCGMLQLGPDQISRANSFLLQLSDKDAIFYYDKKTGTWIENLKDHPDSARYIHKSENVEIPFIGTMALYSSYNLEIDKNSFDINDEYRSDGMVKTETLTRLIEKYSRHIVL